MPATGIGARYTLKSVVIFGETTCPLFRQQAVEVFWLSAAEMLEGVGEPLLGILAQYFAVAFEIWLKKSNLFRNAARQLSP